MLAKKPLIFFFSLKVHYTKSCIYRTISRMDGEKTKLQLISHCQMPCAKQFALIIALKKVNLLKKICVATLDKAFKG